MDHSYHIRSGEPEDLAALAEVERRSATLFGGAVAELCLDHVTPVATLEGARRDGWLWVAVTSDQNVVGYAYARPVGDDYLHLCELDVDPEHGRKGLGSALLATVEAAADSQGFRYVSLTTFRDVPFNAPFYRKRGYVPLDDAGLLPHLADEHAQQAALGFDVSRRVAMRKQVAGM